MCVAKRPKIPEPPKSLQAQEVKEPEPASFFADNAGGFRGLSQGQGFTGGIGSAEGSLLGGRGSRRLGD